MTTRGVNPGDVLGGKYTVERILGTGGMGIVVAARHIAIGQRVAVKLMLKEAITDPSQAERFLREAKAAVQLRSNHTARILDVGRCMPSTTTTSASRTTRPP
jgi:serine/threonine-protein kinase